MIPRIRDEVHVRLDKWLCFKDYTESNYWIVWGPDAAAHLIPRRIEFAEWSDAIDFIRAKVDA